MKRRAWLKPDTNEVRKYLNNWKELAGFTVDEAAGKAWYKNSEMDYWDYLEHVQGSAWYDEEAIVHLKNFSGVPGIAEYRTVAADIQLAVYQKLEADQASLEAKEYRKPKKKK
ncbi:hypothetical protein CZ765_03970 [Corynebacterium casei]|nr:hypothetical protein CZ765_03970 [Corynebacterium casei]